MVGVTTGEHATFAVCTNVVMGANHDGKADAMAGDIGRRSPAEKCLPHPHFSALTRRSEAQVPVEATLN
jgi:hypothetical protein